MQRTVKNWLPIVLLAALVVFYLPVLTGTRFFWEDIVDGYPASSYVVNSLRHLQLPYWLPYLSCGSPLIAELSGVFYPLNWLLPLFVGAGWAAQFLGHLGDTDISVVSPPALTQSAPPRILTRDK